MRTLEQAKKSVGARVAELRQLKDWSQAELAERAGFSERHISDIEGGLANPEFETVYAIAHALGVDIGELFKDAVVRERKRGRPPKRA